MKYILVNSGKKSNVYELCIWLHLIAFHQREKERENEVIAPIHHINRIGYTFIFNNAKKGSIFRASFQAKFSTPPVEMLLTSVKIA